MPPADPEVRRELLERGLAEREARWLLEEFGPGEDLATAVERRLAGEPLQYVIGHWPFRSLDLLVDHRVLIPRPETEVVTGVALAEIAGVDGPLVLDLGCGSGAIALSIALERSRDGRPATVVAVDVDDDALEVARLNAERTGVVVELRRSRWFDDLEDLRGRVDLVVANPPYVAESELVGLDPVLAYEPRVALVADDADGVPGFGDVAEIIERAPQWLAPGGTLVVEHGSTQGGAARELARRCGLLAPRTEVDLAGLARCLVARWPA